MEYQIYRFVTCLVLMGVRSLRRKKSYADEDAARDSDRKKRDLESKGAPFAAEIIMCDQLSNWCAQYNGWSHVGTSMSGVGFESAPSSTGFSVHEGQHRGRRRRVAGNQARRVRSSPTVSVALRYHVYISYTPLCRAGRVYLRHRYTGIDGTFGPSRGPITSKFEYTDLATFCTFWPQLYGEYATAC
jgi:hypothetical protein